MRPEGRFDGTVAEPRPGLQQGHMPNAINIPWGSVHISFLTVLNQFLLLTVPLCQVAAKRPLAAACGGKEIAPEQGRRPLRPNCHFLRFRYANGDITIISICVISINSDIG